MKTIKKLIKSQDGATAIEYGLIAALICVAIIPAFMTLGTANHNIYTVVSEKIGGAIGAAMNVAGF